MGVKVYLAVYTGVYKGSDMNFLQDSRKSGVKNLTDFKLKEK